MTEAPFFFNYLYSTGNLLFVSGSFFCISQTRAVMQLKQLIGVGDGEHGVMALQSFEGRDLGGWVTIWKTTHW